MRCLIIFICFYSFVYSFAQPGSLKVRPEVNGVVIWGELDKFDSFDFNNYEFYHFNIKDSLYEELLSFKDDYCSKCRFVKYETIESFYFCKAVKKNTNEIFNFLVEFNNKYDKNWFYIDISKFLPGNYYFKLDSCTNFSYFGCNESNCIKVLVCVDEKITNYNLFKEKINEYYRRVYSSKKYKKLYKCIKRIKAKK